MKTETMLAILIAGIMLVSCGGPSAADYQHIIDEYKEVLCIGMNPTSFTAQTEAFERQLELNDEYLKSLAKLSTKEKQKFQMQWAKILAQVADGDCP